MRLFLTLMTLACVPFLAGASCATTGIQPCDVLVNIPDAPPQVNKILVSEARPTAIGLARHKERYKFYKCQ